MDKQQYNDQADNAVNFQYLYMLTDDFKRLIWKVRTNDGCAIIIKFTRRYNHNAHILYANQGLAPKLYFHNNQDIYRFKIIIMDYADGIPLSSPLVDKASLSIQNKIFQDVQNAISTLCTNNLIFSDLRLPNMLMVNNCKMLVDFEWCGEDNNARYPFLIS
ncbi:hypothetical protein BC938DRAFT_480349 [Jimgerdemannia flammicorona]|uniref:Protein kinase domain-containing protein n=1 Tax=Jimgerdemannia flammicorona TaxID=994334 RepID=A0A433QIT1_9FUNG|nr:hypothetical protein BC938DRAFT_480349 [Jimgerdemannia flammicorona]